MSIFDEHYWFAVLAMVEFDEVVQEHFDHPVGHWDLLHRFVFVKW